MIIKKILLMNMLLIITPYLSALEPLADESLSDFSGQAGLAISSDISINTLGGPLNSTNNASWSNTCAASVTDKECGARIAISSGKLEGSNGLVILDGVRGDITLEGMTIKTRTIDSGFGGDGAAFDQDVLEIGLPGKVAFKGVTATLATSNSPRATDVNYAQTDIVTVKIDATVNLTGNLLLFPDN